MQLHPSHFEEALNSLDAPVDSDFAAEFVDILKQILRSYYEIGSEVFGNGPMVLRFGNDFLVRYDMAPSGEDVISFSDMETGREQKFYFDPYRKVVMPMSREELSDGEFSAMSGGTVMRVLTALHSAVRLLPSKREHIRTDLSGYVLVSTMDDDCELSDDEKKLREEIARVVEVYGASLFDGVTEVYEEKVSEFGEALSVQEETRYQLNGQILELRGRIIPGLEGQVSDLVKEKEKLQGTLALYSRGLRNTALFLGLTVFAGALCNLKDNDRSNEGISIAQIADGADFEMRPEFAKLPSDISDMGAILFAAVPLEHRGLRVDNLLDNRAVSRALFGGKFLLTDVVYDVQTPTGKQRAYCFALPSPSTGETLDFDAMRDVTLSQALNSLTDVRNMTDDQVRRFLVWWYKKTFRDAEGRSIILHGDSIVIKRSEKGYVKNITYDGYNAGTKLRFAKAVEREGIPVTSRESRVDTHEVLRSLVSARGNRLLLWTGLGQEFVVPEDILIVNRKLEYELPGSGGKTIRFNYAELADSVRRYYEARDQVESNGRHSDRYWAHHYVMPDDPIIQRVVAEITEGARSNSEKMERIRKFAQQVEWKPEMGGYDVNRPATATLLQMWGDCNNRSTFMATLFAAAGFRVAMVDVDKNPDKLDQIPDRWRLYGHSLVAVAVDNFEDGEKRFATAQRWEIDEQEEERQWVMVETGGDWDFGYEIDTELYEVDWLVEVPPIVAEVSQ